YSQSPVVSGSGVVTLNPLDLICSTDHIMEREAAELQEAFSGNVFARLVLQPQMTFMAGDTITAGLEKRYFLDGYRGKFSHSVVAILAGGATNANNGLHNYVSPGDSALVDVKDVGNQSIWGCR